MNARASKPNANAIAEKKKKYKNHNGKKSKQNTQLLDRPT